MSALTPEAFVTKYVLVRAPRSEVASLSSSTRLVLKASKRFSGQIFDLVSTGVQPAELHEPLKVICSPDYLKTACRIGVSRDVVVSVLDLLFSKLQNEDAPGQGIVEQHLKLVFVPFASDQLTDMFEALSDAYLASTALNDLATASLVYYALILAHIGLLSQSEGAELSLSTEDSPFTIVMPESYAAVIRYLREPKAAVSPTPVSDKEPQATQLIQRTALYSAAVNKLRETRERMLERLAQESQQSKVGAAIIAAAADLPKETQLQSPAENPLSKVTAADIDAEKALAGVLTPGLAEFIRQEFGPNADKLPLAELLQTSEYRTHNLTTELLMTVAPAQQTQISRALRTATVRLAALEGDLKHAVSETLSIVGFASLASSDVSLVPTGAGKVRPIGVADLKIVKQQLQSYELGEIAYIENVLEGETRKRTHTRTESTEQQVTIETTESSDVEKDLQVSERFELSQELEKTQAEEQKQTSGISLSASYGPVTIAANTSMDASQSVQEAERTARRYTRESVSRAAERLQKSIRKFQSIKTLFEVKESNEHSFVGGADRAVGVYRWVQKQCWCQTINYGARIMFEFNLPDPAANYIFYSQDSPAVAGVKPPAELDFKASDIDEFNYLAYAARYQAIVADPPVASQYKVIPAFSNEDAKNASSIKIDIPETHELRAAGPAASWTGTQGNNRLTTFLGATFWSTGDPNWNFKYFYPAVRGSVTPRFHAFNVTDYAVGFDLLLTRTPEAYAKWRLKTYSDIADAYREQKSQYDRQIAAAQGRRLSQDPTQTDQAYRHIEKTELKRGALELLTDQHFDLFGAVIYGTGGTSPPQMENDEALAEGKYVAFFERAFEWDQVTYEFLPYFWASKREAWAKKFAVASGDPVFESFLRAGFARVAVPLRRSFERNVLYYLKTGQIWDADGCPVIDDPFYLALISEVDSRNPSAENEATDGQPEGSPWRLTVPTNLVCLEKDGLQLPSWKIQFKQSEFLPSKRTCGGVPYNAAQWPDDGHAVVTAFKDLGYKVDSAADPLMYLRSADGRRVVAAFQKQANAIGLSSTLGQGLSIDGIIGPCTLRALTVATAMIGDASWPGPA
jgi:hypothetical protein